MPHISYPEPCVIVELCETTAVPSGLFYQMQMKTPSQPADVARVIREAVTAKEPRLRYLVGDDAERLVGRQRLTARSTWRRAASCPTRSTSTSCGRGMDFSGKASSRSRWEELR